MPLRLFSATERKEFLSKFPCLVDDLTSIPEFRDMVSTNEWLTRVLNYNVPHGKATRGLLVALAFKCFSKKPTNKDIHLSHILGWCLEMLHASCLIFDDVMDRSERRRGQPCWHLVDGVGQLAINDGLLVEHAMYKILRLYFRGHTYYTDLMEIFHEVTYKTAYGQSLDTRTSLENDVEKFDFKLYANIVKYKTSCYSFILPISLGMIMAGITDLKLFLETESVLMDLGFLFQMQDDHLDIFGDPKVTGKLGSDIQTGKCNWLVCKFLELASPEQHQMLIENYGKGDDPVLVERVKKLFLDLDLPGQYKRSEQELYDLTLAKIEKLSSHLPANIFQNVLHLILGRRS